MARTSTRVKSFQIPEPGHQPLKVTFCKNEYTFTMPTRLYADALRGYLLAAIAKMAAPVQEMAMQLAKDAASAKNMEEHAAKLETTLTENQKIASAAGTYMATVEIFEFICRALNLTARERAYAEDNYDHAEMFRVFIILQGALMRPFGGTRNASPTVTTEKMTDSTGGANGTQ
jgi:hypothetical protein